MITVDNPMSQDLIKSSTFSKFREILSPKTLSFLSITSYEVCVNFKFFFHKINLVF